MKRNNKFPINIYYQVVLVLVRTEGIKGYTVTELREQLQLSHSGSWRIISTLREMELIYVIDWKKVNKVWAPMYAWGYKRANKVKPKPQDTKITNRNFRERRAARKLERGSHEHTKYSTPISRSA